MFLIHVITASVSGCRVVEIVENWSGKLRFRSTLLEFVLPFLDLSEISPISKIKKKFENKKLKKKRFFCMVLVNREYSGILRQDMILRHMEFYIREPGYFFIAPSVKQYL